MGVSYICEIGESRDVPGEEYSTSLITYVEESHLVGFKRVFRTPEQHDKEFTFDKKDKFITDHLGHRYRFDYTEAPTRNAQNELKDAEKKVEFLEAKEEPKNIVKKLRDEIKTLKEHLQTIRETFRD